MNEILWGYDISSPSFKITRLGVEIISIKQMFAGILFQESGIKGIIAKFSNLEQSPIVKLSLVIDDEKVFDKEFHPVKSGDASFLLNTKIFPKKKVEIILTVQKGELGIFSTSVGTGMGFTLKKGETKYQPTSNFSIGVLV